MPLPLISRSHDLQRLVDEGYEIEVTESDLLLVRHVPYVTEAREVAYGILLCPLNIEGDKTGPVNNHQAYLIGTVPCDADGKPLEKLVSAIGDEQFAPGIVSNVAFSHMPLRDGQKVQYADYFEKMDTYVKAIAGYAREIDKSATAKIGAPPVEGENQSVFKYRESATGQAGIGDLNPKLALEKVAIVGTGGTGSYILDFLVKTPILEIHIFDRDYLLNRNAMRAPGAASLEELIAALRKVDYFYEKYSVMRHGIVPHAVAIDAENVEELKDMSFVFLAMDGGDVEREVAAKLNEWQISFISVGMGVRRHDDSLRGTLRTTISTSEQPVDPAVLGGGACEEFNDYEHNVQIAELNALNAALAVIRFKRMLGYYADDVGERESRFKIQTNKIINEVGEE